VCLGAIFLVGSGLLELGCETKLKRELETSAGERSTVSLPFVNLRKQRRVPFGLAVQGVFRVRFPFFVFETITRTILMWLMWVGKATHNFDLSFL
jgi:hypothetical protein